MGKFGQVGQQVQGILNKTRQAGQRVEQALSHQGGIVQRVGQGIDRGIQQLGTSIVQPIENTVQKIQTTVIVSIVLFCLLVVGLAIGAFFAGQAVGRSSKKSETLDAALQSSALKQQSAMMPMTPFTSE